MKTESGANHIMTVEVEIYGCSHTLYHSLLSKTPSIFSSKSLKFFVYTLIVILTRNILLKDSKIYIHLNVNKYFLEELIFL